MDEIVYVARVGNQLNEVIHLLRRNGLNPGILDDPNPVVVQKAINNYNVRVTVPQNQVEKAIKVLAAWECENLGRAQNSARQFKMLLLRSSAVGVVGGVVIAAFHGTWESLAAVPLLAFLVLLGISFAEQIRDSRKRL